MITCILNGRLGNQMYQIAATIGTALNHNIPYCIPKYTLDNLFPAYFNHFPSYGLLEERRFRWYSFSEKNNEYTPIQTFRKTKLNGYFQSYKYFENHIPEIRQAFNLPVIHSQELVSVHVRRGDYINNPDFPFLGLEYYMRAMSYFISIGLKHFVIFSDDIPWCKEHIRENGSCTILYSEGHTELQDMTWMAGCGHHICANSSFSIMAATLNTTADKIVVAPQLLFKNANKNMIPGSWTII